jgi:predicted xylose isomerase-like sugar epimerase
MFKDFDLHNKVQFLKEDMRLLELQNKQNTEDIKEICKYLGVEIVSIPAHRELKLTREHEMLAEGLAEELAEEMATERKAQVTRTPRKRTKKEAK